MLGLFGFSVAAITFVVYGLVAMKFKNKSSKYDINSYGYGFFFVAIACAVWALTTQSSNDSLNSLVLVGDAFLLLGSIVVFRKMLSKSTNLTYDVILVIAAVAALTYRAYYSSQSPIMHDGILVFYTPRLFGALLVVVMFAVWFRANMNFHDTVIAKMLNSDVLRAPYFSFNLIGFIGISGFLFARKSITIIFSFSMLVLAYLSLAALNYIALRNKGLKNGQ